MSFRNFMYKDLDEDLSFMPAEKAEESYGVGSPSTSVNNNEVDIPKPEPIASASPQLALEGPSQLVENVADSDDPADEDVPVFGSTGIADRLKSRKGTAAKAVKSTNKRKNPLPTSGSRVVKQKSTEGRKFVKSAFELPDESVEVHGLPETKELPNALAYHRIVDHVTPPQWKSMLENMSIEKFCDMHDNGVARQAVMDNHLNAKTRDLLRTVVKLEVKCDKIEGDVEKNPVVQDLREKIAQLIVERGNLKLEEAKVITLTGQNAALEAKCAGLESEKVRLGEVEVKLREEIDGLKMRYKMLQKDRAEVVSKVVPYIAMELYHSDELGAQMWKVIKSAIFHGRCLALEEAAKTGKPVDLSKIECYRPTSKAKYDEAGNAFATAEYSFLAEATKDPMAPLEDLLSKKPRKLKPTTPTKKTMSTKPVSVQPSSTPSPKKQE